MRTMRKRWLAVAATVALVGSLSIGQPAQAGSAEFSCTVWSYGLLTPVVGNWDGIGGDGIGVVSRVNGKLLWQLRQGPNPGPSENTISYGIEGDIPIVGNWDGVGGDGIGVIRWSRDGSQWEWHLRNAPQSGAADLPVFQFGSTTGDPVVGNWDGIGGDGVGVVYRDAGQWHVRQGPNPGQPELNFVYTASGLDAALAGNWDGVGGDGPAALGHVGSEYVWGGRNGPNPGSPDFSFKYGRTSGCPVAGNWDGVGGDGPGIAYGDQHIGSVLWHLRNGPNAGNPEFDFVFP
jgi:hypothetical protein